MNMFEQFKRVGEKADELSLELKELGGMVRPETLWQVEQCEALVKVLREQGLLNIYCYMQMEEASEELGL